MAIIPKPFMDAVVSLGVRNSQQQISWIGTGFFVGRKVGNNGNVRPYLITNKHVVERKDQLFFRMKEQSGSLKVVSCPIENKDGSTSVLYHQNPNIDIAVIALDAKIINDNNLLFPSFDIDTAAMDSKELRENGVDEGTLIHMLGFPMRLVNVDSGLPICRLGCIARMSEAQIEENHNILVDIQNFPGNSGSPVVIRPEQISIEGTKALDRCVLAGIIHSYISYEKSFVNSQTGKKVEIRSENSGLALMHPVEYIREIIDRVQPQNKCD